MEARSLLPRRIQRRLILLVHRFQVYGEVRTLHHGEHFRSL